ncbi:MAG: PocR ligand-binding domain-containing protein [Syntrophaceae bacterium]|nr:PocR ligand-binding domain-containing protein [Syntrophaceae bacterium]
MSEKGKNIITSFGEQRIPRQIFQKPPENNLLCRIIDSFQEATKLRVRFVQMKGKEFPHLTNGEGPAFCRIVQSCSAGRKRCLKEIIRATKMSIKTGEPYIFQCHADMIECAAAILDGGHLNYALVCGPVLLRPYDTSLEKNILRRIHDLPLDKSLLLKSLSEVLVFSERRVQAASDLLFAMANYFSKVDWIFQKQQREISMEQARLAEELYMRKESENSLKKFQVTSTHPREDFFKENELIELIKRGDKKKARVLLDELLGTVLFRSHEHIGILKARMLEIIVIIARAAVEAGANLEEILGYKYHFFQDLSKDDSQENLYYCLLNAFDQLCKCIYQNRNILHPRIFIKAKDFIWANYNQEISLKKAAKAVGISPYYLSHLFRKEMGITFLEYLTSVRLSIAKRLLKETSMTALEVCLEIGYQDPSHFAKVFKKREGVHPSEYRKKLLDFEPIEPSPPSETMS